MTHSAAREHDHQSPNSSVPILGAVDHARVHSKVLASPVIKGPIIRRPKAVGLAEKFDADAAGVTEMQRLRSQYGSGPVQLKVFPGRKVALLLDPADVHRVLNETPDPFSPASLEKRGALNHFQPGGALVSSVNARKKRRPFNEAVLQTGRTVHSHADAMTNAIREEVDSLRGHIEFNGALDWDAFSLMWWRIVRRVVLGDSARNDQQITEDLNQLRERGNLAYLVPKNRSRRKRFTKRLRHYLELAQPGSLAAMAADVPASTGTMPEQQIPQWMFAFDAASWATFRAMSLLSADPETSQLARKELDQAPDLPTLRAVALESLRLWPTTPLILRETTKETQWRNGTLDKGTSILIFAPFFHRDDETLADAHCFAPELWLENRNDNDWPLVPFSGGLGMCPGRNVVLLTASMVLGELFRNHDFTAENTAAEPLDVEQLPGTLSPFSSRFITKFRNARGAPKSQDQS
ncbi:MAG: cytochrome P450 [Yaniella sp.]|uniref:cytochrome P450 n=1 Tax=Yaniella sp. TaxID=2773929 RepID=UPI00264819B1|nr:cytochrome P450 [Yaniella sp.]MDN6457389.1 cytochrome P450 [Yaniella sp.]